MKYNVKSSVAYEYMYLQFFKEISREGIGFQTLFSCFLRPIEERLELESSK